ncbi:MAG TPA: hypothetical protein PKC21_00720 [Oligoflexia bacterium]|nr:hypothetical protein [Oligoflexia bacterium]HMR23851.1 hypothetical protein [Oligoflexia bacterium]
MKAYIQFILLIPIFSIIGVLYPSTTEKINNDNYYNVGVGDVELDLKLNSSFYGDNAGPSVFTFQVGGNYFISKNLAPGIELFIQDVDSQSQFRVLPNIKLYLPDHDRILPYAQVGLGVANVPQGGGLNLRLGAGVNYLLTRSVAIGLSLQYDFLMSDEALHRIEIPVGFHFYFKY